jgi:S1-C subfamily serine protease
VVFLIITLELRGLKATIEQFISVKGYHEFGCMKTVKTITDLVPFSDRTFAVRIGVAAACMILFSDFALAANDSVPANFFGVAAAFVVTSLFLGLIGMGVAVSHEGNTMSGFIVGCCVGLIVTIFMLYSGMEPPHLF